MLAPLVRSGTSTILSPSTHHFSSPWSEASQLRRKSQSFGYSSCSSGSGSFFRDIMARRCILYNALRTGRLEPDPNRVRVLYRPAANYVELRDTSSGEMRDQNVEGCRHSAGSSDHTKSGLAPIKAPFWPLGGETSQPVPATRARPTGMPPGLSMASRRLHQDTGWLYTVRHDVNVPTNRTERTVALGR